MANYKPQLSNAISIAGIIVELKKDVTIVALYDNINALTAADSMLDTGTGAVYSVPAGKTLTIIGIKYETITAFATDIKIYEGDTEDATTTLKVTLGSKLVDKYEVPVQIEIAAGKFVVYDPLATYHQSISMLGYET